MFVSILRSVSTLVEVLKEGGLVLESHFFVVGEALELGDVSTGDGSDLIENVSTPNITLLDVVKSFIAGSHEVVNVLRISHFVVLSPIQSKLHLCLLGGGISAEAVPINNERHIAAVLTEKSEALHVSLGEGS